jgi:hypothetical protein
MESPPLGEELWTMFPNFWPPPEPTKSKKTMHVISFMASSRTNTTEIPVFYPDPDFIIKQK